MVRECHKIKNKDKQNKQSFSKEAIVCTISNPISPPRPLVQFHWILHLSLSPRTNSPHSTSVWLSLWCFPLNSFPFLLLPRPNKNTWHDPRHQHIYHCSLSYTSWIKFTYNSVTTMQCHYHQDLLNEQGYHSLGTFSINYGSVYHFKGCTLWTILIDIVDSISGGSVNLQSKFWSILQF